MENPHRSAQASHPQTWGCEAATRGRADDRRLKADAFSTLPSYLDCDVICPPLLPLSLWVELGQAPGPAAFPLPRGPGRD